MICLAAAVTFLVLARALPAGRSTGDTGPGALPGQVAIFGIICAICYLVMALRGSFAEERPDFSASHRALTALAIFAICLLGVNWLGLAACIALASALITLLFSGERRLIRAVATGAGVWLIAVGLFQRLLGLPMP
ncbi:MAG: tripartite tricarboxylate transporter TctB family protein [Paracoccus sp. (in: a-proteobacteria)]|nr:tripartite tricarboxylate transporter TctB family protein [Paracoccus sp. (in: a-proteobacteria)]